MNSKKSIVFIVDSLSQPRCIKRIMSFANNGFDCKVYGYDRGKYTCNVLPNTIKVTILGEMKDGTDYLQKIKILKKDISRIVKDNKSRDQVFYSFGFFSTLFLYLHRKVFVYEISDILYGYPKFSKIMWLLKWLDKRMIKQSLVTVMTSEGFRKFFGLSLANIIVQPNKVSNRLLGTARSPMIITKGQGLTFSFIGAIRYETIYRFADVIGSQFPQHQFFFYGQANGNALKNCQTLTSKYSNVRYFGAYKNPEDLAQIYSKINVVVACYTPTSLNERLAEPNKLYEALFFCKPIVVSDGIFLAKQVDFYQCGFCVDATNEQSIIDFLSRLDTDAINQISSKEYQMNPYELVDNPKAILDKVYCFYTESRK